MKRISESLRLPKIFLVLIALLVIGWGKPLTSPLYAGTAEQLYADLAKLPAEERHKKIEEGARREGKLSFIHTWRGKAARKHMKVFKKRYPFLKVEWSDMGSQDASERLIAEETAGRHLTDALTLGIPDLTVIMKQNLAAKYPTPATKKILSKYKGFLDPDHRWVPWYWSEHGISYNPTLISSDKAPKKWSDLCNPAYKGKISFEPAETRFLVGLYFMMGEEKLQEWLKCIGKNKPIIQRGHTARLQLMLAGDHAIQGDNYLYKGTQKKLKDPEVPFVAVYSAPILAYAAGVVINKNAPHPHAAALLADWMLSKESQTRVAKRFRGTITTKHPYMPADAKLVTYGYVTEDIVKRLHDYWIKNVGRKR